MSAQGSCSSMYWLASRTRETMTSAYLWISWLRAWGSARSFRVLHLSSILRSASVYSPGAGTSPPQFLWTMDSVLCARLP